MKKKPKTGILQRFFKIICLAVTLTSAGFLIYHMVYLPMENKKLVAELKGNFPEPEAPGASGSEKKDQPAGRKCPVAAVDLVSLREQYPDVQGWLTIPDTGIDYPVLQSEQENGEFYLKRNYKKEYDINGSLFLQADRNDENREKTFSSGMSCCSFLKCRISDLPHGISSNGKQKAGGRAEREFPGAGSSGSLRL